MFGICNCLVLVYVVIIRCSQRAGVETAITKMTTAFVRFPNATLEYAVRSSSQYSFTVALPTGLYGIGSDIGIQRDSDFQYRALFTMQSL